MEWYYEHNGQQAGPVSRAEIIRLILQRRIHPHTLVWTAEFGDQWRPASKAGLIAPLSIKFMTPSSKAEAASASSVLEKKALPAEVPSLWSWFILLPGLLNYMLYGLDIARGQEPFRPSVLEIFFMAMILMIAVLFDRRTLVQHGYRAPSFLWFFLWGLCPPCYLWSRYIILKKGMVQAVLAVLMWAGMAGLGGYYLYQHPDLFKIQMGQIQVQQGAGEPAGKHVPKEKMPEKSMPEQKNLENGIESPNQDEIQL